MAAAGSAERTGSKGVFAARPSPVAEGGGRDAVCDAFEAGGEREVVARSGFAADGECVTAVGSAGIAGGKRRSAARASTEAKCAGRIATCSRVLTESDARGADVRLIPLRARDRPRTKRAPPRVPHHAGACPGVGDTART